MKLFPTQELIVPLARSPALVVHDLDAALDRTAFHHLFRDRLVGDASDDRIKIRRVRWFWHNDFSPRFVGRVRSDGRVIEGVFRLSTYARGFLAVWLVLLLVLFLPVELIAIAKAGLDGPRGTMLAMIVAFIVLGSWAIPRLGWWMGRSDTVRIEAAIRLAAGAVGA